MTDSSVSPVLSTAGSIALPRLARPLTLPCPIAGDFGTIEEKRRGGLRTQRHFLLRGTAWINHLEIGVVKFHNSELRNDTLDRLRGLGPEWQTFCDTWEFDKTKYLGKGLISNYLAYNELDNGNRLTDPEPRFLSYYRAVGLFAFFYLFLEEWFNDGKRGAARRREFQQQFNRRYYSNFLLEHMEIEPVIYKHGNLSDDQFEYLFGTTKRLDPRAATIRPDFIEKFKERVSLPWDDRRVRPERVVEEIFLEERCSTFDFIKVVSEVTKDALNLPRAPKVRHGGTFLGPKDGIVIEPFVDIRVKPEPWLPTE